MILASGPEADRLQAGVPCSFVTGLTSSSLPLRGYSPGCCRSRSPAPFLYGQKLCRSRDSCVEQSAIESTRRKTQFSELQAPAENSLVYCWPQRNVNNYLLRYRNTLTYLLTILSLCVRRRNLCCKSGWQKVPNCTNGERRQISIVHNRTRSCLKSG